MKRIKIVALVLAFAVLSAIGVGVAREKTVQAGCCGIPPVCPGSPNCPISPK